MGYYMGTNISSKEEILRNIINNGPVIAFLWKAETSLMKIGQ